MEEGQGKNVGTRRPRSPSSEENLSDATSIVRGHEEEDEGRFRVRSRRSRWDQRPSGVCEPTAQGEPLLFLRCSEHEAMVQQSDQHISPLSNCSVHRGDPGDSVAVPANKAICDSVKGPIHQSGEAQCAGDGEMEVDSSVLNLCVSQILHQDVVHREMDSDTGSGSNGKGKGGGPVLELQASTPVSDLHTGGVLLPLHLLQDTGVPQHAQGAKAPALKAPRAP